MKNLLQIVFVLFTIPFFQSQILKPDEIIWDKSRKLSTDEFHIKTDDTLSPIRSTVIISWELMGFSVFNKNFNQNVTTKIIKSASLVNPNLPNVEQLIDYQQTIFDLAEIYARKMRRDLFLNKSKLWKGFDFASEILNEHLNEFHRVQLLMDRQTNSGNDADKLKYWQDLIKTELSKTQQYDYQNKAKINPEKNDTENPVFTI
ncbi:hypothetical protein [Chryseobacterium sp. MDT2-18]|uniref:hypothetical protein n=1 Tax=Chryseobacterium sp. MDT2-18 TaxID=1259136 RepID=UPI00277D2081|nr:hypothetical protein [Chryseobacterium sp. MDT2-18]MDQ0477392.1 hypothetical protein [Chryseobacterium sp. MDT2-18]